MKKIRLVYDTVKYLKFKQIVYRGLYTFRKKVNKKPCKKGYDFSEIRRIPEYYRNYVGDNDTLSIADGIINNIFPFYGGETIKLAKEDWELEGNGYRLKCFKLNSFDYLCELSAAYNITKDKKYIDKGFSLIDSWIDCSTSIVRGDKWNPYVTANRIRNWIGFLSLYASDEDMELYAKHISIATYSLRNHVEYQLLANHLLSEGKALMYGGYFLGNDKVYNYGKKLLFKEYSEQFLGDGGHFERSISYHLEAIEQYFEAAYLMSVSGDNDYKILVDMIKKSYVFLDNMLEVNGKIPLFNDAADDYTYDAKDVLATAAYLYKSTSPKARAGKYFAMYKFDGKYKADIEWTQIEMLETGIYKDLFFQEKIWYDVMIDVGDNGPDYNLGHTHADALSILLTSEKGRIFADSGVYTYENCDLRSKCRGTDVHNTIAIDGENSAQVWGAFRTAKRGHTKVLSNINNEEFVLISAVSDGYKKILKSPVLHTREYSRRKCDNFIILKDLLQSKSLHEATLRFNLGVDCKADLIDDFTVLIDGKIYVECSEKLVIEQCEIAEKFGDRCDTFCIKSLFEFEGDKEITTKITFGKERN